jgi:putative oxidoreductase
MTNEVDLAMLLVRLALGPMLIAHGLNKVFGPGGLAGTERWFAGLGFRPAGLHARVAALNEVSAGALVLLGLLTPVGAAAFVGLMAVASLTDHRSKGYFVFKGGWEYTVLVAMVAPALAVVGPGRWSLDRLLGLGQLHGIGWGAAAVVIGLVAAGLVLGTSYRPSTAAVDA